MRPWVRSYESFLAYKPRTYFSLGKRKGYPFGSLNSYETSTRLYKARQFHILYKTVNLSIWGLFHYGGDFPNLLLQRHMYVMYGELPFIQVIAFLWKINETTIPIHEDSSKPSTHQYRINTNDTSLGTLFATQVKINRSMLRPKVDSSLCTMSKLVLGFYCKPGWLGIDRMLEPFAYHCSSNFTK